MPQDHSGPTKHLNSSLKKKKGKSVRWIWFLNSYSSGDQIEKVNIWYLYVCVYIYIIYRIYVWRLDSTHKVKSLEETSQSTHRSNNINDGSNPSLVFCCIDPCLLTDQRPQFIQVDSWAEALVPLQVVMPHTNFPKVTWMAGKEKQPPSLMFAVIS